MLGIFVILHDEITQIYDHIIILFVFLAHIHYNLVNFAINYFFESFKYLCI
jgi:ABC-type uncharacterized transport system permease subunit